MEPVLMLDYKAIEANANAKKVLLLLIDKELKDTASEAA